jgi:asparagine synthase (glutamine-hydrolysing)
MCGVAGIVGRISDSNRAALARMNRAMKHRGPDGSGVWESPADARGMGVMLGHTRLSILDLSNAASQPMVDPVTGHVLVYNGEIYNYVSLRDRLTAAGQSFRSTGDTAVVLRALALHGADAVPWLRGMFAFASWDPGTRKLLLARDPLGMKPLYLARRGDRDGDEWSLAFASELRALLASGLLGKPGLDPSAVASIVWNGFVVGPTTVVSGVEALDPGQLMVFDGSGREQASTHYWSMQRRADVSEVDELALARELEECVHLHLASDVPLGVFLSGGIDSSAVANLAQKAARSPIHTFTLSFEEREFDEGPHAKRIAQAMGTDHHEVVLSEDRFVTNLADALDSLDQPTFDGLNAYYMSHAVRDAGFTVALVGTGGDELFGGYTTFRDLPPMLRWARRALPLPRAPLVAAASVVASALAGTGHGFPPQTRWAKLPEMVRQGDDLVSLYQLAYALFLPDAQRNLLGAEATSLVDGMPPSLRRRLEREIEGRSALSAISVLEERMFLGERLLPDNDAASMAASIEQRLPLVDHVLFGHVDRLPDRARYAPVRSKSILRRIGLRGLDPALFDRPKSGFTLPFDRWIRKGLHRSIDQTLRDPGAVRAAGLAPEPVERLWRAFLDGAPGVYWSRVWALFVHIRWCQKQGIVR